MAGDQVGREEERAAVAMQAKPGPEEPGERPAAALSRRYQSPRYRAKRILLGPPLKTSQLANERISKRVALAVFSSDPISSTAYATEEILLVLVTAAAATWLTLPVALAIVGLLLLLVVSYRQVIEAYPSAGGAYVVSRDNFGNVVASVAGAALLIDYVLTVAVSVSGGVAAMVSLAPEALGDWAVEMAVAFVLLLTWGNLRGIREAGRIFAVPTYLYVVSVGAVVTVGIWRSLVGDLDDVTYSAADQARLAHAGEALGAVTVFLILRAFASGTTALTGVEAISNGVSAFRRPQARNANRTLLAMAVIMGSLFLGISYLAAHLGIRPFEEGFPTVVAQLGRHVIGAGPLGQAAFVVYQTATLLILVLAANTSFSGFPLLASFAAEDALLPRQLRKRGHRLVHSNGIVVLATVAVVLIVGFRARVSALIPLYAIGVVLSFTLSQAGMTVRHLRLRERGWRYGLGVNGLGALVTFVVLWVIVIEKFEQGAWMVCVAVPVLVLLLLRTQKTYRGEVRQLKVEASQRLAPPKPRHEVVVLVEDLDRATIGALQYARQLNPLSITAVHVAVDPDHARELAKLWAKVQIPVSLEVVDAPDRNLLAAVEEAVAERVRSDTEVSVLIPKRAFAGFWHRVLHDRTAQGVFRVLGEMDNVNVTIVPFRLAERTPASRSRPGTSRPGRR
jgi:amino acid transporter